MCRGASVWWRPLAWSVSFQHPGGENEAVWTEVRYELRVCKITMTRHDTASLIKHNSSAGGTSDASWALSWDSGSRGAPVCASPPSQADGWEVLCWRVLARMPSTVRVWVAVRGSQRSQLAVADCEGVTEHRDPDCLALAAAHALGCSARISREHPSPLVATEPDDMFVILLHFTCSTEHWHQQTQNLRSARVFNI